MRKDNVKESDKQFLKGEFVDTKQSDTSQSDTRQSDKRREIRKISYEKQMQRLAE